MALFSENTPLRTQNLKLSYCYGGIVSYEPGEVLGPRELTDFEAVLIMEGNPVYETKAERIHLKPGSIHVAQPNTHETYYWDTEKRTRHAYLHFALESIPEDWPEEHEWATAIIDPSETVRLLLKQIIERAIQRPDWPTEKPGFRQNRLMEVFLDQFLYTEKSKIAEEQLTNLSDPVSRAVKFMRERIDSPVFMPYDLEELSQKANTTSKHLCRVFTKELGLSPIKASRQMQLQLAIPLLARTNLSIKEVSERCGFTDQLYFSRYFSKTFGIAPTKMKEQLMNGDAPPHNPLPPLLTPRLYW